MLSSPQILVQIFGTGTAEGVAIGREEVHKGLADAKANKEIRTKNFMVSIC
jgi:hypothetical protein